MPRAYSKKIIAEVEGLEPSIGKELAEFCIEHRIPIVHIAAALNVSRQTVYNWFTGVCNPDQRHHADIEQLMQEPQ